MSHPSLNGIRSSKFNTFLRVSDIYHLWWNLILDLVMEKIVFSVNVNKLYILCQCSTNLLFQITFKYGLENLETQMRHNLVKEDLWINEIK